MKDKIIKGLKIGLPISAGFYLIWLISNQLTPNQKKELFNAFSDANYFIIAITIVFGLISHISRGIRWRFLLDPLGYKPSIQNCYHSVMIGYIINLIFPRAGEASRAGYISKYENIPFNKAFGTIMAERVIDVFMLGFVGVLFLITSYQNIDDLIYQIQHHPWLNKPSSNNNDFNITALIGKIITVIIALGFIASVIAFIVNEKLRNKIKDIIKGFSEGLKTIYTTPKKGLFILHTFIIWFLYVAMFKLALYALPETSSIGIDGALAAFIAGTVGLIFIQGGIGVYPILVGIVLTIYMGDTVNAINPDALAIGWIIWVAQTAIVIFFGSLSLILMPRINAKKMNDENQISTK